MARTINPPAVKTMPANSGVSIKPYSGLGPAQGEALPVAAVRPATAGGGTGFCPEVAPGDATCGTVRGVGAERAAERSGRIGDDSSGGRVSFAGGGGSKEVVTRGGVADEPEKTVPAVPGDSVESGPGA